MEPEKLMVCKKDYVVVLEDSLFLCTTLQHQHSLVKKLELLLKKTYP